MHLCWAEERCWKLKGRDIYGFGCCCNNLSEDSGAVEERQVPRYITKAPKTKTTPSTRERKIKYYVIKR